MTSAILEGLTATIIGMAIVFAVLGLLAYILSFFKYLAEPKPVEKSAEITDAAMSDSDTSDSEIIDEADDNELVAVISAAIYAAMGTDGVGAVIKSIKPVRNSYTPWNVTAKRDNQRGLY